MTSPEAEWYGLYFLLARLIENDEESTSCSRPQTWVKSPIKESLVALWRKFKKLLQTFKLLAKITILRGFAMSTVLWRRQEGKLPNWSLCALDFSMTLPDLSRPWNTFFLILGLSVGGPGGVLRLRHVWHTDDHWEAPPRRQGLHRSLPRPLHRLCSDLQEGSHPAHAEGKKQFILFWERRVRSAVFWQFSCYAKAQTQLQHQSKCTSCFQIFAAHQTLFSDICSDQVCTGTSI